MKQLDAETQAMIDTFVAQNIDLLKQGGTLRFTSKPNNRYKIVVKMPDPAKDEFDIDVEELIA